MEMTNLFSAGGGTFIRLVQKGHDVSVAYQTSGSIAVSNEEALRFAEFAEQYALTVDKEQSKALRERKEKIKASLAEQLPGEVGFLHLP